MTFGQRTAKSGCSLTKILLQLNSTGTSTNIGLNVNTGINMTKEPKLEVVFVPGCFDSFEGTQEELDALQAEIMEMFANKSSDEIKAMSTLVGTVDDLPDFDEVPQRKLQ